MQRNIYIIHGYTANPAAYWFPWLKREVKESLNQHIEILAIRKGKHFIDRDNIKTLPTVYEELCLMCK